MELYTGENDKGRRLDRVLRKALSDLPLPLIHRMLRKGQVLVNGKRAKAQDRLDSNVKISIPVPEKDIKHSLKVPGAFSLDILWQDIGLIAVNKPAGLVVHGQNSLDEMVRGYLTEKLPPSLSFKPGPLHRLDKPSSGIVVFSAGIDGARLFSKLMRDRKVRKTYLTILEGTINREEIWEDELVRDKKKKKTFIAKSNPGGKTAVTKITPLSVGEGYSLVMAQITTGRTHQIRAQASTHGHPLAGDIKYGGHGKDGFFLHAWKLEFLEYLIEAPLPDYFPMKPPA